MKSINLIVGALVAVAGIKAYALPVIEEADTWGGRKERLAVVNPVTGVDKENVISLRGDWTFSTMNCGSRNGLGKRLYLEKTWPRERKIKVPGCWAAQGVGGPGMSECWDIKGDNDAKPIRHKYMGFAYYRKTVKIPSGWKGKRIWLKVGGVKSCGWFWVNERQVAMNENYCGTYKYEITDLVQPGADATVIAQITNLRPSRKGQMSALHKWGGIYRDIEIEATPKIFIDDAWVRGDFDGRLAEVHVSVCGSAVNTEVRATIEGIKGAREQAALLNGENVLKFPLKNFRPWSPDQPNLYTARVDLVENGKIIQTRRERFGVRKFEVRGKDFFLNGKPFYLRGFGDDSTYPISGITPADRNFHRAHLLKARKAGFNFARLHTHCEVPEYFEAADEVGIMIQAELPYYGDSTAEAMDFNPKRDVTELWKNYRRHPSFAIYSNGNEGSFGPVLDRRLYDYVKSIDPDRLKIAQDCHEPWSNPPEAADFLQTHALPWSHGSVKHDRPFVAHEYLNLSVKSDSRDEKMYTGVWFAPVTRKARAEWLSKFGLGMGWGDRLQDAQHALQKHYQKQGVEWIRMDPYCDGFWFWTMVDVVVENRKGDPGIYTAQGLFNPFWEQKRGGASADDFAQFNSDLCLLLNVLDTKRIFVSGDVFDADFSFANYSGKTFKDVKLDWKLGNNAVSGSERIGEILPGAAQKVASTKIKFPEVAKAVKMRLSANIGRVANYWDFWVYPRRERQDGSHIAVENKYRVEMSKHYSGLLPERSAAKAKVVVAEFGSQLAAQALSRGQRVITLANTDGKPNLKLGWWWLGKQTGVALAHHPALQGVPHEGVMDPLMFRLVSHGGLPLPYRGLKQDDMLIVGESGTNCVLHLAQAKIGNGKACMAFGLDLLNGTPEAVSMFDGLLEYATSDRFLPESEVTMDGMTEFFMPELAEFSLFKPLYDPSVVPMLIPGPGSAVQQLRKTSNRNAAIELSRQTLGREAGFTFCRFGSPQGATAPKFPAFEGGELVLEVENVIPIEKMAVRVIDAGSNCHMIPVKATDFSVPGRHSVKIKLPAKIVANGRRGKGRSFRLFALAGFEFVARKPCEGTMVRVGSASMRYRARPADALALEIDTGTLPRIVSPDSEHAVKVGVRNVTDGKLDVHVTLKLADIDDNDTGWLVERRLKFAPGEVKTFKCPVPVRYGAYYVKMRAGLTSGRGVDASKQQRSFAYFKPNGQTHRLKGAKEFCFGSVCHLNPYFGNEKEIVCLADAMTQVGLKILRTNFKPEDVSDYEWYDKVVDIFSSRGLDFDFILDAKCHSDGKPDIEKSLGLYRAAFTRYKGRIRYWEFENEPDIDWSRKHPLRAPGYAELAMKASALLREIDPKAQFMSSGFCCFDNPIMGTFQRDAMSLCWRAFDLHCFHGHGPYYEYRDMIDGKLLPMRKELGIEIPWYANETALTMSNGVGEKEQAEALVKKLLFSWSRGAKGYTWYNMRGKGENPFENEHGYGMLTMKLDPRAVYCVWNALIGICRGKSFEREIDCGEGNRCFLLRGAEGWAACLWRERAGKERVVLRTAATDVSKIDMFGNASPYEIVDNRIALDVSQEPIWLLSELGKDLILQ